MSLYHIVRPLVRLSFRLFFRRIIVTGTELLPLGKPFILASNHPTGFIDPCLTACFLPCDLHFLARGDVFENSLVRKVLESFNMIPIYRFRDGFNALKKNADSFDICSDKLSKGAAIMIFSEGTCIHERRVRNIQKGTARMALNALEKYPDLDLYIVPLAIHYSKPEAPRSLASLQVCAPIRLADFGADVTQNPQKVVNTITREIESTIKKGVPHITDPSDEVCAEQVIELAHGEARPWAPPALSQDRKSVEKAVQFVASIEQMPSEKKETLKVSVASYFDTLHRLKVKDENVIQPFLRGFSNALAYYVGWLPFAISFLVFYPIRWFTSWFVKNKVKHIEFHNSFRWVLPTFLVFFYLLILLVLALAFKSFWGVFLVLLLPFVGYYSLSYAEFRQRYRAVQNLRQLDVATLNALKAERAGLVERLLA